MFDIITQNRYRINQWMLHNDDNSYKYNKKISLRIQMSDF